jgi:uncharacterized protein (UPF0261 family)
MLDNNKYILMLGCFDTKGEDFSFLRQCIIEQGENVITINTGVMGTTDRFPVDFESDLVALEAGESILDLREKSDRGHAIDIMGLGAAEIVGKLLKEGKIKAAIGMGGGGGTYIAILAMQEIPIGIPKLCLTTLATKDLSRQIGSKDITLMPSIVDVAGLNNISRLLMRQAAGAICGMANVKTLKEDLNKKCIAISMFGNTTTCVDKCSELLEKQGYEILVFHANGVGGRAMETLIREGYFEAVLDITTTELADDLCGGICSAGPERLNAAAEIGIPQVVVPGCLDMVNFAQLDTVPQKYKDRKLYRWAPDVTLMRTNKEENEILGKRLAGKLNQSKSAVSVLLPTKGVSQIDAEDEIFYYPEVNRVLFDSIIGNCNNNINVVEIDAHVNDNEFSERLVQELLDLMNNKSSHLN